MAVYTDMDKSLKILKTGNVKILEDEQAIIQSIKTILATVSGERVRNPIGASLVRLLFQPINDITRIQIEDLISSTIYKFEDRVNIVRINVIPMYEENAYDIQIELQIKRIRRNLNFSTRLRSLVA